MSFVEFKECSEEFCFDSTDVACVSCDRFGCPVHLQFCIECDQPVCHECYLSDLCCLVRPWGEKTERQLRNFYENTVVNVEDFYTFTNLFKPAPRSCCSFRTEVARKSFCYFVDNFDETQMRAFNSKHSCSALSHVLQYVVLYFNFIFLYFTTLYFSFFYVG